MTGNSPPPHLQPSTHTVNITHAHTHTRTQATPSSRNQDHYLLLNPVPSFHHFIMAGKSDNGDNGSAPGTPKAAGGGGFSSLTAREQEILAKAMTCLKTAPEVSIFTRI